MSITWFIYYVVSSRMTDKACGVCIIAQRAYEAVYPVEHVADDSTWFLPHILPPPSARLSSYSSADSISEPHTKSMRN